MRSGALVALLALGLAARAAASEDEAWLHRAGLPAAVRPLLLLLVDTSASMRDAVETLPPYDPARDYTGSGATACRRDRVYWRAGSGPPPGCEGTNWVRLGAPDARQGWRCAAGTAALDTQGFFVAARAAQWEQRATGGYWRALVAGDDGAVECRADRGRHGATAGAWYATDGAGGPWAASSAAEPDWNAPPLSSAYVFFTGNYLAYLASPERVATSRYEWLVRRIGAALRATTPLEVAVARFSHDGLGGDDEARGGMVALAPTRVPEGAAAVAGLLSGWEPAGPAPVTEALAEVTRWLAGEQVGFGDASRLAPGQPLPSAPESRSADDPSTYRTPFDPACRPLLLAVATAGRPGADAGGDAAVRALPDLGGGDCTDDCAAVLLRRIAGGDLLRTLPGRQRAAVRWLLPEDADPALGAAALAGGRVPLPLDGPLSVAMLVAESLQNDAGEPGLPRVSAAGLESRPFTSPDTAVYFALSRPEPAATWPGNLRRFRLLPPDSAAGAATVAGRDDAPAFDDAGRLRARSWSEWAGSPDGADPTGGGAAAALPDWRSRVLYADLTDAPLTDASNRLEPTNPRLTRERLGLAAEDERDAGALVEWLRGRDAFDEDLDGDRDEVRWRIGDPGVRALRILRYGPAGPGLVFAATNDGLLHAFDADSGTERWAFMPSGLLHGVADRARPGLRFDRQHALDGPMELWLHDANRDGRIDPGDGDQAWLFVALGRGGTGYYALDVSDPVVPALLWHLGPGELPGFAQSWAAPVPARIRLDAATQGGDARVVVLAGGYDPVEDAAAAPAESAGAALTVVAAGTGRVLWRAGGAGVPGADLELPFLQRSLPAAPRLLDTDGDGLHDRAYVLDVAGQLLRFDFPGNRDGGSAVTVRRVAVLGTAPGEGAPRRFQVTPDAVPMHRNGHPVLALAFGSGWASRPRSRGIVDRFYVVFDPLQGTAGPLVGEPDLTDVTDDAATLPADARGWMFRLAGHGDGEKVTGGSLTFDHRVRFTTWQPLPAAPAAPCGPPAGLARLYTLDVRDGRPVNRVGDRAAPEEELGTAGPASALGIAFTGTASAPGCPGPGCRRTPQALLGGRVLPLDFRNDPVRTSWRQLDADAE